jgi:pimeloyl-ACP methyl ester carboxylesterase
MPSIIVNGVDLYSECHGEGEPLMLIAGLASDSQSWLAVLEDLSRNFFVIIVDNRGTGRTTPQDAETSIAHIADDSMALVKHLKLPSVTLLGHSMGGFVALDCAIRYPGLVSRLVLACTSAFNSQRNNLLFQDWVSYQGSAMKQEYWFRNLFYWILSRPFFENSEVVDAAVKNAMDYPYPQSDVAFQNQVQATKAFDCQKKLATIQQQTLIICVKKDLLF